MGGYLSTANSQKHSQLGSTDRFAFYSSSMQGWRVSMEDSHLIYYKNTKDDNDSSVMFHSTVETFRQSPAVLEGTLPTEVEEDIYIFGVFDGHGGSQVARFCATNFVREFTSSKQFQEKGYEIALRVAFCNLDRILKTENWTSPKYGGNGTYAYCSSEDATSGCYFNDSRNKDEEPSNCKLSDSKQQCQFLNGACLCNSCNCSCTPVTAKTTEEDAQNDSTTEMSVSLNDGESLIGGGNGSDNVRAKTDCDDGSNVMIRISHSIKQMWTNLSKPVDKLPPLGARSNNSCNPAMVTGCTAIVCMIIGDRLYTANAGDSRAVLCRSPGLAEPLSVDHKPNLPGELLRIERAGGSVEYGRVNGNLNLSRAIGDLMYKQEPSLPVDKQIVSCFPDVTVKHLTKDCEFVIMGCDGIWEFFSSQDVVEFIRSRLPLPVSTLGKTASSNVESGKPLRILEDLFDTLVSPNPAIFEYGCDNMTALLIDLQPGQRCTCSCHDQQRSWFNQLPPGATNLGATTSAPSSDSDSSTDSDADESENKQRQQQPVVITGTEHL